METIRNYLEIITLILAASALFLLGWSISLQISLNSLKRKNKEIFSGKNIKNFEEVILSNVKSIRALDKDIQELYNISNQINTLAFKGIHKIGLIRFNPFKEVGGDQSFAMALLNGKNNGTVISSLYTREGTRIYAKSVSQGKADKHPFTQEEEQAIKVALSGETKKM